MTPERIREIAESHAKRSGLRIEDETAKRLAHAIRILEEAGIILIDPKEEPSTGDRYAAGEWSRRNYEAWLEDHQACAALQRRIAAIESRASQQKEPRT